MSHSLYGEDDGSVAHGDVAAPRRCETGIEPPHVPDGNGQVVQLDQGALVSLNEALHAGVVDAQPFRAPSRHGHKNLSSHIQLKAKTCV